MLNQFFGNVELTENEEKALLWLSGWEISLVENITSAISKMQYRKEKDLYENKEENQNKNTYSIYQLKSDEELKDYRWEALENLKRHGLSIEKENYNLVYTSTMPDSLDMIYEKFNLYHPQDFKGHSLSVSDVVVLHKNGVDTAYYVDRFGFEEIEFKEKDKTKDKETSKLEEIRSKGTKTEKNVEDKPLEKEYEKER